VLAASIPDIQRLWGVGKDLLERPHHLERLRGLPVHGGQPDQHRGRRRRTSTWTAGFDSTAAGSGDGSGNGSGKGGGKEK
jgi:hypothetical protein